MVDSVWLIALLGWFHYHAAGCTTSVFEESDQIVVIHTATDSFTRMCLTSSGLAFAMSTRSSDAIGCQNANRLFKSGSWEQFVYLGAIFISSTQFIRRKESA